MPNFTIAFVIKRGKKRCEEAEFRKTFSYKLAASYFWSVTRNKKVIYT